MFNFQYSKIILIICGAHDLHYMAAEVRDQFISIEKVIANVKNFEKVRSNNSNLKPPK